MAMNFLEFEQPIAELEAKIEELKFIGSDASVNITEEIKRLQSKSRALTTSIFANLTPWQITELARHPQRLSVNIVNVLGMVKVCRLPLALIVTMRGEQGEFNPWQVPMGEATARVLETMGVAVRQAGAAQTIAAHVQVALRLAFEAQGAQAVLIAQRVIGIKSFQDQRNQ